MLVGAPGYVLAIAGVSSARECAAEAAWDSLGADGDVAWGVARGYGPNRYTAAVDTKDFVFRCECRFHTRPCMHSKGLLLRHLQGQIPPAEPPQWVAEWVGERREREARQAARALPNKKKQKGNDGPAATRWNEILAGLDECDAFLIDIVSHGLLTLPMVRTWSEMASRMVDARLPGVEARVRGIETTIATEPKWAASVATQLGQIYLLIEAAKRIDKLEEGLQADVRHELGVTTRQDKNRGEVIYGVWDIVGQTREETKHVRTHRTWLRLRADGRFVCHTDSKSTRKGLFSELDTGSAILAEVRILPSSVPIKGEVLGRDGGLFQPGIGQGWKEAIEFATQSWARNPWLTHLPVQIHNARLGRVGDAWHAIDDAGDSMPILNIYPWRLLALSGNEPCEMFGELDGSGYFRAMGAWGKWSEGGEMEYVSL